MVKIGVLTELLFPRRCFGCGKEGSWLCPPCEENLPRAKSSVCPSCAKACFSGFTHPGCLSSLDGLWSAFFYRKEVKKIVSSFKFSMIKELSSLMAGLMMKELRSTRLFLYWRKNNFVIVPLPIHPRRYLWRGFNQAELLAKNLANDLSLGYDGKILFRQKLAPPQTKLSSEKRKENIKDQFATKKRLRGNLILVDDVWTTGSTLKEAAKTLKKSGANLVWGVTFCR